VAQVAQVSQVLQETLQEVMCVNCGRMNNREFPITTIAVPGPSANVQKLLTEMGFEWGDSCKMVLPIFHDFRSCKNVAMKDWVDDNLKNDLHSHERSLRKKFAGSPEGSVEYSRSRSPLRKGRGRSRSRSRSPSSDDRRREGTRVPKEVKAATKTIGSYLSPERLHCEVLEKHKAIVSDDIFRLEVSSQQGSLAVRIVIIAKQGSLHLVMAKGLLALLVAAIPAVKEKFPAARVSRIIFERKLGEQITCSHTLELPQPIGFDQANVRSILNSVVSLFKQRYPCYTEAFPDIERVNNGTEDRSRSPRRSPSREGRRRSRSR
jgi:hypothetical protein